MKYQIKNVLQEIDQTVINMINITQMVGGSFIITYRRCGKSNCWCSQENMKGHPSVRITFNVKGRSRTKAIPKEDMEWVKDMTDNYKNFRRYFQELRQREKELNDLLKNFEKEVKRKTSHLKAYL